jgi:hypothetical protein
MQRTTLYLDDDAALKLRHQSETDGKSQAEHVRAALKLYFAKLEEGGGNRELPPGAGQYRSGRADVSANAEALLRAAARAKR